MERERAFIFELCQDAGKIAMRYWRSNHFLVVNKPDDLGPVTDADREIDAMITQRLVAAFPHDAILSEEADDTTQGTSGRRWFVDPIDGTREFIDGSPEFAVMIGLTIDGSPVLGVVMQPAIGHITWGQVGLGAFVTTPKGENTPIRVSSCAQPHAAKMVHSRSHYSAEVAQVADHLGVTARQPMGSFGVKVAAIAAGSAEFYLNLSAYTALWDTAAPAAILLAAGGDITSALGEVIDYREIHPFHRNGMLASNGCLHRDILHAVRTIIK